MEWQGNNIFQKRIVVFTLLWLLVVNVFALLALNRLNLGADTAYLWIDSEGFNQDQSWNPVALHARWDSVYYIDIAENGYHLTPGNTLSNVVFFPLYPLLVKVIAPLLGGDFVFAGWLVSALSLFAALLVFYTFLQEFHPTIDSEKTIFYLLVFPTSFFLNAIYTESLFLLLSLLTFYYAKKGRFGLSGVFGLLASLTRVTGVLLLIPVLWEFFKRYDAKKIISFSFLLTLLIPLGTFSFFLYHYFAFGDFFLFLNVESAWGRAFQFNAEHFTLFSNPSIVNFVLDLGFVALALFALYYVFWQKWVSYGLYMFATLGVALGTGTLMSIGRYLLVLFPIYIALASIRGAQFEKAYTLTSVLLLALNITLFVNWYWAG